MVVLFSKMAFVGLNVISIFKCKQQYKCRSRVLRQTLDQTLDSGFSLPLGEWCVPCYEYSMQQDCLVLPKCQIIIKHAKWQLRVSGVSYKFCTCNFDSCKSCNTYRCVLINVCNSTGMFWVLSLGFPSFQCANLLFVQYYSMLSAFAVYDNYNGSYVIYVLYSTTGPVVLNTGESAIPQVYCYLPMMLK